MPLSKELNIPDPRYNPDDESHAFYTAFYDFSRRNNRNRELENKKDSPDQSRASLIKRVHPHIESLPPTSKILDLGAGRQIFEKEYEDAYGKPKCQIVTMDIASIPANRLLAQGYPHIQASGRTMPFGNEQFDAVVSNMAFDFMLPEGLLELNRITKPDAPIFLNLHHPSLVRYDIETNLAKVKRQINNELKFTKKRSDKLRLNQAVLLHHEHLRDNRLLFETEDQIREYFSRGNFDVLIAEIKSDLADKWWEVDLIKQTLPQR